jgi:hypothetical protein
MESAGGKMLKGKANGWKCLECGKKMSAKTAMKAVNEGCSGCGGSDIDIDVEVGRLPMAGETVVVGKAV